MSDMARHWCRPITNVRNCPKMAWKDTRSACQTQWVGRVMLHPPPHIWAHPRDQSQTTTLLNPPFLTIDTENQKDSTHSNSNNVLDNTV